MFVKRSFKFDAAHNLVSYKGKCERLHGHTYRLIVWVKGVCDREGIILDFVDFKDIVKRYVIDELDHAYLNERFKQPSTENIALWIWDTLKPVFKEKGLDLYKVELFETEDCSVVVKAET